MCSKNNQLNAFPTQIYLCVAMAPQLAISFNTLNKLDRGYME